MKEEDANSLPLVRNGSDELVRASFAQESLWFFEQMVQGSSVYNIPLRLEIVGLLDLDALKRSFSEIVRRHESLRTSFVSVEGEPWQRVEEASAVPLPLLDLRSDSDSAADAYAKANERARQEALISFDLGRAPLIRACVLRLSGRRHHILVTMHHIVSDGTSIAVFLEELNALYTVFRLGGSSRLPELPIQYPGYSTWQRAWLTGHKLQLHLDYWLARLRDLPTLQLPTDRPRPAIQAYASERLVFEIPLSVVRQIRALGRSEGATPFMVLLAAFSVLLGRYADQYDVAVGVPIEGRGRQELESMIGLFLNTLVLRLDLSGEPSFRLLVRQARERSIEAYDHQDLPFATLVEQLKPARDLSRPPCCQVALQYVDNSKRTGASVRRIRHVRAKENDNMSSGGGARFDLVWALSSFGDRLLGQVDYSSLLYDRATIHRFVDNFKALLTQSLAQRDSDVHHLSAISALEYAHLTKDLALGDRRPVTHSSLFGLFFATAQLHPETACIVAAEKTYSYRSVLALTRRIANFVHGRALGEAPAIAVHISRTYSLLPLLLAINRLGAAFVPLDKELPNLRKAAMLRSCGAALLIHDACDDISFAPAGVASNSIAECLVLGRDHEPPSRETTSGDPAYQIFTSGSTGLPKVVVVPNSALVNYVASMADQISVRCGDRVLAITTVSFDIFITELFVPLVHGATIILGSREDLLDPKALTNLIEKQLPTHLQATPTTYRMLIESGWQGLRGATILCGGEPLSEPLARDLLARCSQLWNCYGPSETTVWSLSCRVVDPGVLRIGAPLPNQSCYLLRAKTLTPAPLGAVAEIAIGGAGLAFGYRNLPELTAERFVASPFASGERLYLTGDLGRFRADDSMEFLGRRDSQVKVRGHRIELGEIEACLLRCDGVSQVAVAERCDSNEEKHLVAYYTPALGMPISMQVLREFAATQLPSYMVPAFFVCLPEGLPRSQSGKLNRQLLPALEADRIETRPIGAQARTAGERLVAGAWSAVLGGGTFGVDENFFDRGGHSLKLARVLALISPHATRNLNIIDLFRHTSIRSLAAFAFFAGDGLPPVDSNIRVPVYRGLRRHRTRREIGDDKGEREIRPRRVGTRQQSEMVRASFSQQRLWFFEQMVQGSGVYNMTQSLAYTGKLNYTALRKSLLEIVKRHEPLRTVFESLDGEPWQRIEHVGEIALPLVDLRRLVGLTGDAEARRLAQTESQVPFDLRNAPLVRAKVLRLLDNSYYLLVTMHHIAADGASMSVFLSELNALYASFREGRVCQLPRLSIQYTDYSEWQREVLTGALLKSHLDYWAKQLRHLSTLRLPTDNPRPLIQTYTGECVSVVIRSALVAKLRRIGAGEGATFFMVLLAAFSILLGRYSAQEDVAVGIPIAGRGRSELEPLIGLFVNTLVMRIDLSGDPSFRQLLAMVRDRAIEAYEHQDCPFGKLVETLQPPRDLSRSPLCQVVLNFNDEDTVVSVSENNGASFRTVFAVRDQAKMDITLYAAKSGSGFKLDAVFNRDLFSARTIRSATAALVYLLRSSAASPESAISCLSTGCATIAGVRAKIEAGRDAGDAESENEETILDSLAKWASRNPGAVAVLDATKCITYAELAAASSIVALRVRQAQRSRGEKIAFAVTQGAEVAALYLGLFKAGACAVPLDLRNPTERLAFLLCDARAGALFCAPEHPSLHENIVHISPDNLFQFGGGLADSAPQGSQAGKEDTAYLIYTSGSTGQPKAVAQSHGNLLVHARRYARSIALKQDDRLMMVAHYSFDAALMDLFGAIFAGAAVLVTDPALVDLTDLANSIIVRGVTVLHATPTYLRELCRLGLRFTAVRAVVLGGEPATPRDQAECELAFPSAELINGYGPSESTTALQYKCPRGVSRESRYLPVGWPIGGADVRIVNKQLQQVKTWAVGEIAICGVGVALGYHGVPALTAKRFVENPFASGDRLYLTGDLARYRPDGCIEFLGRADSQTKVRGHRVEPGEIEACLLRCAGVSRVVVVTRDDLNGDVQLVAYYVESDGATVTIGVLRAFAALYLPSYMVPSLYVCLTSGLPLLSNGKLNLSALPAPEAPDRGRRPLATKPATAEQRLVAGIWSAVLGTDNFGIDENFFDLGGHSLKLARVLALLLPKALRRLTIIDLFQHTSVRSLAAFAFCQTENIRLAEPKSGRRVFRELRSVKPNA
jgi:amino acid adenylation domain-containing protein